MIKHLIHKNSVIGFSFFVVIVSSMGVMNPTKNNGIEQFKISVTDYVMQNLNLKMDDLVIDFPNLDRKFNIINHSGKLTILPGKKRIKKGIQNLKCGFFEKSQLTQTFTIAIRIRTFQNVITSKKRLSRLQTIKKTDLTLSRCETTHISGDLITRMEQIIGLRTKRLVKPGEILTENMIEKIPLISRGSSVDIYFQKGIIDIIVPGITRQDGNAGEKIRVKCLETNKIFHGSVVDARTVIVQL